MSKVMSLMADLNWSESGRDIVGIWH